MENKFVNRKLEKRGVVSPCHERLWTWPELEPTIYLTQNEHANHYTIHVYPLNFIALQILSTHMLKRWDLFIY